MPFPFSFTNKIEVPFDANKHTPDNLLSSIVSSLKNVKARNIQNDRNRITFSGGILRLVMNWNILAAVSSGEITVEKDNDKIILNYHIKFTEMSVITTAMVLGFMGPFLIQAPNLTLFLKIIILAFIWLWLFGGNYYIIIFRFPRFIRKMTEIN
jgi:hypothetical protein